MHATHSELVVYSNYSPHEKLAAVKADAKRGPREERMKWVIKINDNNKRK